MNPAFCPLPFSRRGLLLVRLSRGFLSPCGRASRAGFDAGYKQSYGDHKEMGVYLLL